MPKEQNVYDQLNIAIAEDDYNKVQQYLEKVSDPYKKNGNKEYSPLHIALVSNRPNATKALINSPDYDASRAFSQKDKDGYTPIQLATSIHFIKMVLTKGRIDKFLSDPESVSIMDERFRAVYQGLESLPCDVKYKIVKEQHTLSGFAMCGMSKGVDASLDGLLPQEQKEVLHIQDGKGDIPLTIATEYKSPALANLLEHYKVLYNEHGLDSTAQEWVGRSLKIASRVENTKAMDTFLDLFMNKPDGQYTVTEKADLNQRYNLLHHASQCDRKNIVRSLLSGMTALQEKEAINANDSENYTPLMIASEFDATSVLSTFVQHSKEYHTKENIGKSLLITTSIGNVKATNILLNFFDTKKGQESPLDVKSGQNTLLHEAIMPHPKNQIKPTFRKSSMVKEILEKVKDKTILEAKNENGQTAAQYAEAKGNSDISDLINEKYTELDKVEKKAAKNRKKKDKSRARKNLVVETEQERASSSTPEGQSTESKETTPSSNTPESTVPPLISTLHDLFTSPAHDDLPKEEYLPKIKSAIENITKSSQNSEQILSDTLEYKKPNDNKNLKDYYIDKINTDQRFKGENGKVSQSVKKQILWKIDPELKPKRERKNSHENISGSLDGGTGRTSPDNSFALEGLRQQLHEIIPNGEGILSNRPPYNTDSRDTILNQRASEASLRQLTSTPSSENPSENVSNELEQSQGEEQRTYLLEQELLKTQMELEQANYWATRFHQGAVTAQEAARIQAQMTTDIACELETAQQMASSFSEALCNQERSFNRFFKGVNKSITDNANCSDRNKPGSIAELG